MKRTLTALTLCLATAVSGTPAAADPDAEDIARVIAGVAAAALIAKAVSDHRKKGDTRKSGHTLAERIGSGQEYVGRTDRHARIIDGRVRPVEQYRRHGYGHGYKKKPLPASCKVIVETSYGDRLAYGTRCLQRSYKYSSRLPSSCETLVRGWRGLTSVYGARCLARDGWRVAGR